MKRRDFLKTFGLGITGIILSPTLDFSEQIPKELACPNCGGRLLIADVNLFECEYCGSLFRESTREVTMEEVEEEIDDSPYFYKGGLSIRTSTPKFSDWSSTPGVLSADPDPTSLHS